MILLIRVFEANLVACSRSTSLVLASSPRLCRGTRILVSVIRYFPTETGVWEIDPEVRDMVFLREEAENVVQWELLQVRLANCKAPCLNMLFIMMRRTDQLRNDRGLIRTKTMSSF